MAIAHSANALQAIYSDAISLQIDSFKLAPLLLSSQEQAIVVARTDPGSSSRHSNSVHEGVVEDLHSFQRSKLLQTKILYTVFNSHVQVDA